MQAARLRQDVMRTTVADHDQRGQPVYAEAVTGLPFVDEHRVLIGAPPAAVWAALTAEVARFGGGGGLAALLGTEPRRASGTLPEPGATIPGFAVDHVAPGRELRLAGRHRFSRYTLTLVLDGGTTLTARTHAAFPGLTGRAYRALVIGSGAHRVAVGRLLAAVRRRAAG